MTRLERRIKHILYDPDFVAAHDLGQVDLGRVLLATLAPEAECHLLIIIPFFGIYFCLRGFFW